MKHRTADVLARRVRLLRLSLVPPPPLAATGGDGSDKDAASPEIPVARKGRRLRGRRSEARSSGGDDGDAASQLEDTETATEVASQQSSKRRLLGRRPAPRGSDSEGSGDATQPADTDLATEAPSSQQGKRRRMARISDEDDE